MNWRLALGLMVGAVPFHAALAQNFPSHDEVCVAGIVSKEKLAKAYIRLQDNWLNLYIDADAPAIQPQYRPQWRRIFTDPQFCEDNPGCSKLNPATKKTDNTEAIKTVNDLRRMFRNSILTQTRAGGAYSVADPNMTAEQYFLGPDTKNAIACVPGIDVPVAAKPSPPIKLPIRLRANSDDLNIDASQKEAFKSLKPATASFGSEGAQQKTRTLKLQAAVGYPIFLDFERPTYLAYFTGEVVPYVAANQTITETDGKPRSLAASNFVAVGALANMQAIFGNAPGLNNVVMVKPQYLWNTKDNSEIASLKFIYAPWTVNQPGMFAGDAKLNTPFQPGSVLGNTWVQLLFDLRYELGVYTDKGTDPKTAITHRSFDRAGSKLGISLATPADGPHVVLSVTETLLFGFAGDVKVLSLFETVLTYYFDSSSNFGVTLSYKIGRDVDTAEKTQSWTAGLSAKF